MNAKTFLSILRAFADHPVDSALFEKGQFLVQVNDSLLQGVLTVREGDAYVTENDVTESAPRWIGRRLGRLPQLAERLIERLDVPKNFIDPAGQFLDTLDRTGESQDDRLVGSAVSTLTEALTNPVAGVSTVVYLTSDAGEGKTTLINKLALSQAQRYKKKECSWLVLPVALGGRPFLRYDDIVIGALANRFRFSGLNMESLVELCKLGFVVLAFDGFEEMFIENSAGEASTALGKLVGLMDGNGAIVVAARKAFFEFKGLRSQSRVYESFQSAPVMFSRLELSRWDESRFVKYAVDQGVPDAQRVYDELCALVGEEHPLLTRAVLIKKVCDIASTIDGRCELLDRIRSDASDHFKQVVGVIVQREAREKWTTRTGDASSPLLTEDEHYDLLAAIALEMWQSGAESLLGEVVDFTADLFAESKGKDSFLRYQVVQRVKQHPLLKAAPDGKYEFDHVEFFHHSLGRALATMISGGVPARDVRHVLHIGPIPDFALETCAKYLKSTGVTLKQVVEVAQRAIGGDPRMSVARENMSGLLLDCIRLNPDEPCTVKEGLFGPDKLRAAFCKGITFDHCYFHRTDLEAARLEACSFLQCDFNGLCLDGEPQVMNTIMKDCKVEWARVGDSTFYEPDRLDALLSRFGFRIERSDGASVTISSDPLAQIGKPSDPEMAVVERVVRLFSRTTGASESLLRLKLGNRGNRFCDEVLPELLRHGVLREVPWHGGGQDRRYSLNRSLEDIERWLNESEGCYATFLARAQVP
jgi:hypothetical protein